VTTADPPIEAPITGETGLLPDEDTTFFRLHTSKGVGYVVAGLVVEPENNAEYFEPSSYWSGPEG